MKKILLILFMFLLLDTNAFAKEIIYLKCPEIVTENRSKGIMKDFSSVGKEMGRAYAMITILKSSVKLKFHESLGPYPSKKGPFDSGTKKFKLEDEKYTFDYITNNEKESEILKRSFFKVDNNWKFSGIEIYKEKILKEGSTEKMDISYTIGGKCSVLDKKTYKSIIKKGE